MNNTTGLHTYADYERSVMHNDRPANVHYDALQCPKCKCTFFEEVRVQQYMAAHNVIIGQAVPAVQGTVPFIVLRCVKCQDVTEPRILRGPTGDQINKRYDEFLDEMEGKNNPDLTGDVKTEQV